MPIGGEAFNGMVRSNKTAALIVDCLKEDTDEQSIVDALFDRFDAPREEIAADVRACLNTLRSVGALEE